MILEDLHTHTLFCDGKDTPEDMVKSAIDKGLKTIGFSGHIYVEHGLDYCMSQEDTKEYIKAINSLKNKYKDDIRILCGVEADLYSSYPLKDFDYVIGSVHDVCANGNYVCVDDTPQRLEKEVMEYIGGDFYKLCELYFENVTECVKKLKPDIIGHFDLVSKFNEKCRFFDENHPRYVNAWKKALDELICLEIPFEINTGAMSRGWKSVPYPSLDIMKYMAESSARVILSGDTHAKENLCYKFDEATELAKSVGFTKFCVAQDIIRV